MQASEHWHGPFHRKLEIARAADGRGRRSHAWHGLLAIACALALVPGRAGAAAITDVVMFETLGQGMWGPDKTAAFGGTRTFTAFNQSFANQTVGLITDVTAPNPVHAAWQGALAACLATGLSRSTCISGVDNPAPIPDIPGIGPEPSPTINLGKNGAQLALSNMHLDFGVKGTFEIGPGRVNATVPLTASISVADTALKKGDVLTVKTSGSVGQPTLATSFDVLNAGVSPFVNLSATATLEAWTLSGNIIPKSTILNLDINAEQELAGLRIGDGGLELRIWGQSGFFPVTSGIGTNIPVPGIVPPPLSTFVGFPVADVQLYIPSLDTPPNTSFDAATKTVTNSQLPVTRTGAGRTPIDFFKLDADLDVLSLIQGVPLGVSGGIPLTATVEINALDLDYGNFYGIAQQLLFTPGQIMVELSFDRMISVETAPGEFKLVSSWRVPLGGSLNVIHPGGDLVITPRYLLDDNIFVNVTDLLWTPGFTLAFMQLKFGGLLFSAALPQTNFPVFQGFLPIVDFAPPVNLETTAYELGGFESIAGTQLLLRAQADAAVPEPGTLALLAVALAGLAGFGRARVLARRRPRGER